MARLKLSVYFIGKEKLEDGDSSLVGKTEDWQTGDHSWREGRATKRKASKLPFMCRGHPHRLKKCIFSGEGKEGFMKGLKNNRPHRKQRYEFGVYRY
jgi:hypothetical protein